MKSARLVRAYAARRKLGRSCPCGKPITDACASGKCRKCICAARMADGDNRNRLAESMRRRYSEDPALAQAWIAARDAGKRRYLADPVNFEKHIAKANLNLAKARLPEASRRRIEACARRHEIRARDRSAWCAPDRLDDYHALLRKRFRVADSKAMILDLMRVDLSRLERRDAELAKQMARAA